jgi:hypothetical protein
MARRLSRGTCVLSLCVAALLSFANNAHADSVLYGVTGSSNTASSLYTIDPVTGATTLIGSTGLSHVTGIDFDPITGVLYGVQSDLFGSGAANLLTIDPVTGLATIIGSTGNQIPDITIGSDGVLRGWTEGNLCPAARMIRSPSTHQPGPPRPRGRRWELLEPASQASLQRPSM